MTKKLLHIYEFDGFDVNDSDAVTTEIDVIDANDTHFYVSAASGSTSTFVLEIEGAGLKDDGTTGDFFPIASSDINQCTHIRLGGCSFARMRVSVKTVEGSAGTVDILVNTFWSQNP
jgi:hypothetical protein